MKTFYLLLISALLSACNAGSGEGLDDNGQPIGQGPQQPVQPTPPDSPVTLQANLTSIQRWQQQQMSDQQSISCYLVD